MNILDKLRSISILRFLYYNFFCHNIKRNGRGYFIPHRHSIIEIGKGAKVLLYDGSFFINYNKPKHSHAEAFLIMQEDSVLIVRDTTFLNYQATIEIHKNATLEIGSAYINSGSVILSAKKIVLGTGVLVSRNVFIYDSDHHPILNENEEIINPAKDVVISDHVWIGLKCTLLRGTRIGTGTVIAADSVVGGKIKAGVMAQGNPARAYSTILWRV